MSMQRFAPVLVIVALLIGALVMLNRGIDNNTELDEHAKADYARNHPEEAAKKAAEAAVVQENPVSHDLDPIMVAGPINAAKTQILIGWQYDQATVVNQQALTAAIKAVRDYVGESNGKAAMGVIDVDIPAGARQQGAPPIQEVGIIVNGKKIIDDNPGEGSATADKITAALKALKT